MPLTLTLTLLASLTAQAGAAAQAAAQAGAQAQQYHVVEVFNSDTTTAEQLLNVLTELGAKEEAARPLIDKIDKNGKAVVVAGTESACMEAAKAFQDIGMKTEVRLLVAADVPSPYDESDVIVAGAEELQEALSAGEGVLVVFYAPWCGHCHTVVPAVKEAATELKAEGLRVAAIDGQQSPRTAAHLGVRGYPTIMWLQTVQQPSGEDAIAMANYNGPRDAASLVKFVKAAHAASAVKSKMPKGAAPESAVTAATEGGEATKKAEAGEAPATEPEVVADAPKGESKLSGSKLGGSKLAGGAAGGGIQRAKMPAQAEAEAKGEAKGEAEGGTKAEVPAAA